jgi:hypothetical protein
MIGIDIVSAPIVTGPRTSAEESRLQFRAFDLMTAMILVAIVGYTTEKVIVGTIERRTIEK